MTYESMGANSVDPDQKQSDLGPHCLTKSYYKTFQQMTFVVIGALKVYFYVPNFKYSCTQLSC